MVPLAPAADWLIALVVEQPPSAPRTGIPIDPWGDGDSYVDSGAEWVRMTHSWEFELGRDGWTLARQESNGDQHWTRPGKTPREGASATLHPDGPLMVWTTSLPWIAPGAHSMFGYIACRDFRGDRSACARWGRQQMEARKGPRGAPEGVRGPSAAVRAPSAPAVGVNLPEAFWSARRGLGQVRAAAHSRTRCADAVLAAVLARLAVLTPTSMTLPPIVGATATFDLMTAIVALSGMGKSTAAAIASELLPVTFERILTDVPIGSGEGLVDAYLGQVEEVADDGKKQRVRRQVRDGVHVLVDEGQVVADLANRRGSTLLPVLRSMAMGATVGQANASIETNRRLNARSYRFAALIAIQTEHAGRLLDDAAGGTPQRIVWFAGGDPTIPDQAPSWPGALEFTPPPHHKTGLTVTLDPAITAEVVVRARERARGTVVDDPLDAHRDLLRLKIAGLLGVFEQRREISREDWALAGMVMDTSDAVRATVLDAQRADAHRHEEAVTTRTMLRQRALDNDVHAQSLLKGARRIGIVGHRMFKGEPLAKRDLMSAVSSRDRANASVDEMIDTAVSEDWIVRDGDRFRPGGSRPV